MSEVVYCKYCGQKYPSVLVLTSGSCSRHPNGPNKGKHAPYQGDAQDKYVCEYCGQKYPTILTLTAGPCFRHPGGPNKGRHSPML